MDGSTRLLRTYLAEAKYESLRTLRMPAFGIPFLALPVSLYLLLAVLLFGDAIRGDPHGAVYMFTGFSVMGVMGPGMFGFGVLVALEREQGLLALKRALPMPPMAYLLAKMLMAMLFVAIVMATMMLAAPLLGHVTLSAIAFLKIAAITILGALPFCAIGLFIGTRTSGKAAPAVTNLLYLAMIYLSGFLIPLPKGVQWIALASPAFYLDQLALSAAGAPSHGTTVMHVIVLAGVTLLLTSIAVRRLARVG